MEAYHVVVDNHQEIRGLIDLGARFASENCLREFALELRLLTPEFIADLNSKPFMLTPRLERYEITQTGPQSCSVPILGVKCRLDDAAADYLRSDAIAGDFGNRVLKIIFQLPSKDSELDQPPSYSGRWIGVMSTGYLNGQLTDEDVVRLYGLARRSGDYRVFFVPADNAIWISLDDLREPPKIPAETYREDDKGDLVRVYEEFIPPVAIEFKTIREFRAAISRARSGPRSS